MNIQSQTQYGVYLAGPISGKSYAECCEWRHHVMGAFPPEIIGFSPMRAKLFLNETNNIKHSYEHNILASQRGIFTRDMSDCRRCDGMIANFLGATQVSIGTVMEITAFWWQQKPIVVVMEDDNLHQHPMIREACPFVVHTIDEAIYVMTTILLPVGH